ncbi:MAG: flagellar hook-length control protein FliK [Alphaproteobacteria bacterium]
MNPILAVVTASEGPPQPGVTKAPTDGAAAFLALIAVALTGQPNSGANPTGAPDGSTRDPLVAMQDEGDEHPGDPTQVPLPVSQAMPQSAPAPIVVFVVAPDQPARSTPALTANHANSLDAASAAQPAPASEAPIETGSDATPAAGTAGPAPSAPPPSPSDDVDPTSAAQQTPRRASGTDEGQQASAPNRPAVAAEAEPSPAAGANGVAAVLGDASYRIDAPHTPPTRPAVPTAFPDVAADTAQALVVSRVLGEAPKFSGTGTATAPPVTAERARPLEERPDQVLGRPSPTAGVPSVRTESQQAPVARRVQLASPRLTASDSSMPRGIPLTIGLDAPPAPASHGAAPPATVAMTFFAAFDEPDATPDAETVRPSAPAPSTVVATSADTTRPAAPETSATSADADPLPQAPPAERIAVAIRRAVHEGIDRIRIRLWPAELGHVDVTLHVGRDHRVAMTVAVERPETLDLLQRDARGLERALADSGLKLESGNLAFNLRHGGQGGAHGGQNGEAHPTPDEAAASIVPTITDAAPIPIHVDRLRLVDLRA